MIVYKQLYIYLCSGECASARARPSNATPGRRHGARAHPQQLGRCKKGDGDGEYKRVYKLLRSSLRSSLYHTLVSS